MGGYAECCHRFRKPDRYYAVRRRLAAHISQSSQPGRQGPAPGIDPGKHSCISATAQRCKDSCCWAPPPWAKLAG